MSKKQRKNAKRWQRKQRKANGMLTTQPLYQLAMLIVQFAKRILILFKPKPKPPSPAAPAMAKAA